MTNSRSYVVATACSSIKMLQNPLRHQYRYFCNSDCSIAIIYISYLVSYCTFFPPSRLSKVRNLCKLHYKVDYLYNLDFGHFGHTYLCKKQRILSTKNNTACTGQLETDRHASSSRWLGKRGSSSTCAYTCGSKQ